MTQASTKSLNVWLKTHTWIVSLGDPFNRTTSFNAYLLWRFQAATPPPSQFNCERSASSRTSIQTRVAETVIQFVVKTIRNLLHNIPHF